jgi:predicted dinucleotide-binding enzyme
MQALLSRRAVVAGAVATAALAIQASPAWAEAKPHVGIIGAGNIGGALGKLLAEAGYPVMLSARDLGPVKALVETIGHGARAGTPAQAAAFGEVIVMAVPWGALPEVGRELAGLLKGKVLLDTCNPRPQRDGAIANEGLEKGTGVMDPQFLPGTRLVRAFNALNYKVLMANAHHVGELIAIPIASDDAQALAVARQIVIDLGFEPVVVGGLSTAKSFDQGTPNYTTALTARQLRTQLNIK